MRLTDIAHPAVGPVRRAKPRLAPPLAAGVLVIAFGLIFVLDHLTGAAPVQHLYYLPITYAALRFGTWGGTIGALIAIALYHAANPTTLSGGYAGSDLLQIVVFVAVGIISARLADDARRLHQLAMTDDLTGLHNLRSFESHLKTMVRMARLERTPLSMLVLDVDRLKSLNDSHGHLAGAEAVRTVGRLIARHIPASAAACRYGGDEFVIAVPRCSQSRVGIIAEQLRGAVNAVAPVLAGVSFPAGTLSISVGMASRTFGPDDRPGALIRDDELGEALFRAADTALYAAKNGGRNRIRAM